MLARIVVITERVWRVVFRRLLSARVLIGLLAVGQGMLRLPLNLPIVTVTYGGSTSFGALLLAGGLLVLLTSRWRLTILGRTAALLLAMIYAAFTVAIAAASASGAWIAGIIVLALIAEAGAYD